MKVVDVARVCHEANRAYCLTLGDTSQVPWDEAPQWQRNSAIDGVAFKISHRESTPKDSHENWLAHKRSEGWAYGPVKDVEAKLHPCFLPYEELPLEQRLKDALFQAIVTALIS